MSKKNYRIFQPEDPRDPLENLASAIGNIVTDNGLKWLSDEAEKLVFGRRTPSPQEKYQAESQNLSLQKQQIELAKARTQQLKAEEQLKLTEIKMAEKEQHLERKKQQSSEITIQRTEVDVHVKTEVISGALNVVATSGGLVVPDGQQGADQEWLDRLPGTVGLITGKKGSGKSSMGAKLGEFMQATKGFPFFWLAIPAWVQDFLPSWVRIVDRLEQIPNNSFVLIDEAGLSYLSLHFADKRNIYLRQQLMLCRQKNWVVVFCVQSSRDADEAILRALNWAVFKEPGLNTASTERTEIRGKALLASQAFKQIPKEDRLHLAYVFDENFEGFIQCSLPSFWCEELSNAYGYSNLPTINGRKSNQQLSSPVFENKPKRPPDSVSDEEILELWQKDYGYEKIAGILNCTVYRVRKCLTGRGSPDDS